MKRNSNSFSSSQAKSSLLHALLLLLFGIGSLFQLALQKRVLCRIAFCCFFVSIYCPRTTALKKQPAAADVEGYFFWVIDGTRNGGENTQTSTQMDEKWRIKNANTLLWIDFPSCIGGQHNFSSDFHRSLAHYSNTCNAYNHWPYNFLTLIFSITGKNAIFALFSPLNSNYNFYLCTFCNSLFFLAYKAAAANFSWTRNPPTYLVVITFFLAEKLLWLEYWTLSPVIGRTLATR